MKTFSSISLGERLHLRMRDVGTHVEPRRDAGAELEQAQRRLILAALGIVPHVAERAQCLQQAMRIAARHPELAPELADTARTAACRDRLEHPQTFDQRRVHSANR